MSDRVNYGESELHLSRTLEKFWDRHSGEILSVLALLAL